MKKEFVFLFLNKIKENFPNESIILIGSQSLYASLKPEDINKITNVFKSKELDILLSKREIIDFINFKYGELSILDNEYNCYIDAIEENNFPLPKDFKKRTVNFQINENTIIQSLNLSKIA